MALIFAANRCADDSNRVAVCIGTFHHYYSDHYLTIGHSSKADFFFDDEFPCLFYILRSYLEGEGNYP